MSDEASDFQLRLEGALQSIGGDFDRGVRSAGTRVSVCDTGLGNPDHAWQVEENRRHNARIDRAASLNTDFLVDYLKEVRGCTNIDQVWDWVVRQLRGEGLEQPEVFKAEGGVNWRKVSEIVAGLHYRTQPSVRERVNAIRGVYCRFWTMS